MFAIRGALSVPTLLRWTNATWLTSRPLSMMRGVPLVHQLVNDDVAVVFAFGKRRDRVRRGADAQPDEPVPLGDVGGPNSRSGRHRKSWLVGRDLDAAPVTVVTPAVIRAGETVTDHPALREPPTAMRAHVHGRGQRTRLVAPHRQPLAEELHGPRSGTDRCCVGDRVPVVPERRDVADEHDRTPDGETLAAFTIKVFTVCQASSATKL
jgi:hypothetical protein